MALWYICEKVPALGDFLETRKTELGINKFTLVINEDVLKVGNPLRPDKGRALDAVYWTIKGFQATAKREALCTKY